MHWLVAAALIGLLAAECAAQPTATEVAIPLTVNGLFGEKTVNLVATEYRPDGAGPFPAIVLSHGSTHSVAERSRYTGRFAVISEVFVQWGFVVLSPVRRGYGKSEGSFAEGFGTCSKPLYLEAGLETAKDIAAAIAFLDQRPFVDRDRIVLVGQSGGGWGSLAAASRGTLPLRGVVNFAGGRGGKVNNVPNNNCAPERLVAAAGTLARTTKIPSLWLYTQNDQFFSPDLSQQMYRAYIENGGRAAYRLLPAIGDDGHTLISRRDGVQLWRDEIEAFFREIGVLPGTR